MLGKRKNTVIQRACKGVLLVGEIPPPYGGMAVQTQYLLNHLARDGFDVEIAQINRSGFWRKNALLSKPIFRTIINYTLFLLDFLRKIRRYGIVHIVCCSGLSFYMFAAIPSIISLACKKKIIINYKGGEAERFFHRNFWLIKPILKRATITVPSGFLQDVMKKYGLRAKIVENIIDLKKFKFKIREPRPVFAVTRQLKPIYGIETVIKAFSLISNKISNGRLYIAGTGPDLDKLKGLAERLELRDKVVFLGEIANDEMPHLMDRISILLNASTVDNLPVSILEAFSSGVPVVTTAAGGIPWLVKDEETGLLVKIYDYREMAEKAIRILSDKRLYERLAKNAHDQARRYEWEAVKRKLLESYYGERKT